MPRSQKYRSFEEWASAKIGTVVHAWANMEDSRVLSWNVGKKGSCIILQLDNGRTVGRRPPQYLQSSFNAYKIRNGINA